MKKKTIHPGKVDFILEAQRWFNMHKLIKNNLSYKQAERQKHMIISLDTEDLWQNPNITSL